MASGGFTSLSPNQLRRALIPLADLDPDILESFHHYEAAF